MVGILLLMAALPAYSTRLLSLRRLGGVADDGISGLAAADTAVRSRTTEVLSAALMCGDHPLLGVGPGMYPLYYHRYAEQVGLLTRASNRQPHTLYLGIAAELGLPGLAVFLAILFTALRSLGQARRRCAERRPDLANIATAFFAVIVIYMTSGLFLHFAFIRYFWVMMALAGATSSIAMSEICAAERVVSADAEPEFSAGERSYALA